jgi:hypothetical protein
MMMMVDPTALYTIECIDDESLRPVVEEAVQFAITSILPRIRNLDIAIEMYEFEGDEVYECGFCTREDSRQFLFEIASNQSVESIVRTIIHEMVHVRQYVYGQLKQKHSKESGLRIYWTGEDYSEVRYSDQPWEIEAYELEETLYQQYSRR